MTEPVRVVMPAVLRRAGFFSTFFLRNCLDSPFWLMALVAVATRSLYQPPVWPEALGYALGHAVLYRVLYWAIACRFSPWKMALLWLGSPLLLFSATWLRPVWAVVCTACWAVALWWSVRQQTRENGRASGGVAGYLIVLAWVSLCGAGGYGYQSSDYVMHNGRLLDLIHNTWPVHYVGADGSSQLLVQYAGYYLWPALAGKLAGEPAAMLVQHLWLLMGCWLALRMMVILTGIRRAWLAAVGLLLFGGWDFPGALFFAGYQDLSLVMKIDASQLLDVVNAPGIPEWLDFWPATAICKHIWFGNFISLAASILWAPHQIVAGWVVVGLLCRACRQQRVIACLFVCTLLAYWSPMVLIGISPAVFVLVVWQSARGRWSVQDAVPALAGVLVLGVLGAYYTSAAVSGQPYGVLPFDRIDVVAFVLFLLQSWVLYAILVLVFYRRWLDGEMFVFAAAMFVAAALLSCVYYGVYNDLVVRSSAAIFYGVLLVMLTILRSLWCARARWRAFLLIALLLPGVFSGALNVWQAVSHAGVHVPAESVVDYGGGWQFMGQQDSWFARHLSAGIPVSK